VVSFSELYDFLSPLTHRSQFWVPDAIHTLIQTQSGTDSSPSYARTVPISDHPPPAHGDTIIPCNHASCIPFCLVPWVVVHVVFVLLFYCVIDSP